MSDRTSNRSASTRPLTVNLTEGHLANLSLVGEAILKTIAVRLLLGWSKQEIASSIGIPQSSVQPLLDELAAEIEQNENGND